MLTTKEIQSWLKRSGIISMLTSGGTLNCNTNHGTVKQLRDERALLKIRNRLHRSGQSSIYPSGYVAR